MKVSVGGYDIVFPLLVGTESTPGNFDPGGEILGTAFYLGGGCVITAGHVARALQDPARTPLLAILEPGKVGLTSVGVIQEIEILPHDLAVLRLLLNGPPSANEVILPWFSGEISPYDDLWAVGFPYGLIPTGKFQQFQLRSFKGHAVGNPTRYELPTDEGRPTAIYELSFQAPRGLSGAPLLAGLPDRHPSVAGVIVGNSSQSMIVHTGTEIDSSGKQTTVVERHESLHLGIAIQSSQALQLQSRTLGGTLGAYLAARGAVRTAL
jgi:hypothetical protein